MVNRFFNHALITHPISISIWVTALYTIRYIDVLPFSGFARAFNYETVSTLTSYLIYAREQFSFPLGEIKSLTYPFVDANVGNVGSLPLFAVVFKALGKLFPAFQAFDYFVFAEILSCLVTALFAQKILLRLGVRRVEYRALGALLAGMSFMLLTRSAWTQTFCVVAFPIFMAWIYAAFLAMQRDEWKSSQDLAIIALFPIAALLDNYTLFGILLATFALLGRELFEAVFGGLRSSWNRLTRIAFYCVGGTALSIFALYLIGMYPLPSFSYNFTSYDFGAGGRYHVADLFGPLIPAANEVGSSLLGRVGSPLTTEDLGPGQYEGLAYMGTASLLLWLLLIAGWIRKTWNKPKQALTAGRPASPELAYSKLRLYSPWAKIAIATSVVFIYSLGYELHVLGRSFPDFAGMPAAWISDRVSSLYNLRTPGRLASLFTFFLILSGIYLFHAWVTTGTNTQRARWGLIGVCALALLHLADTAPLLKPVPAQASEPIGAIFSHEEIETLRGMDKKHDLLFIAPSTRAAGAWTGEAYTLAYYLGLKSNLFYIARTSPDHEAVMAQDLRRIMDGRWDSISDDYGNVLIAIPASYSDRLRTQVNDRYEETQIGGISLWSKRDTE